MKVIGLDFKVCVMALACSFYIVEPVKKPKGRARRMINRARNFIRSIPNHLTCGKYNSKYGGNKVDSVSTKCQFDTDIAVTCCLPFTCGRRK